MQGEHIWTKTHPLPWLLGAKVSSQKSWSHSSVREVSGFPRWRADAWKFSAPTWTTSYSKWWQLNFIFLKFTPKIGEDAPNLTSIFFKWVETTKWFWQREFMNQGSPWNTQITHCTGTEILKTTGVFSVNRGPWQASIRTSEPAEPEGEDFFVQLVLWVLLIIWLLYLPLRSCIQSWFSFIGLRLMYAWLWYMYLKVKLDGLPIPTGSLEKGPYKPICRDG